MVHGPQAHWFTVVRLKSVVHLNHDTFGSLAQSVLGPVPVLWFSPIQTDLRFAWS